MDRNDVAGHMDRIESLVREVEATADPRARAAASDLCAALMELHEAGLRAVLARIAEAPGGAEIADACGRDDVIAAMLALHEIEAKPSPSRGAPEPLVQLRVPRKGPDPAERCDLCGAPVFPEHTHLFDPAARKLACACPACAMLFFDAPAAGGALPRYLRVPRRVKDLKDFQMSESHWEMLRVPVRLAFFVRRSPLPGAPIPREPEIVALYPSPAGALEASVPPEAWQNLLAMNPSLADIQPDVEALLVHRLGDARDHLIAPLDRCFELTGALRSHRGSIVWWAPGDSGGEVRVFIDKLRGDAR